MLIFWVRIVTSDPNKITNVMFYKIRNMHGNGGYKSEWVASIKSILC